MSLSCTRRMNATAQTASQLGDNRYSFSAPDRFRSRAIVSDSALYEVAYKQQLQAQFWFCVELRMSRNVGQQLRYNQPKLPAALSFKPQIIRRKQPTYCQAFQSVFRYGDIKPLEVLRGIGEALLIRHVQCAMNIGALS